MAMQTWQEVRDLVKRKLPALRGLHDGHHIGAYTVQVGSSRITISESPIHITHLTFRTQHKWRPEDLLSISFTIVSNPLSHIPTMTWIVYEDKIEILGKNEGDDYLKAEAHWSSPDGTLLFVRIDKTQSTFINYFPDKPPQKFGDPEILATMPTSLDDVPEYIGMPIDRKIDVSQYIVEALVASDVETFLNLLPDLPNERIQGS